MKMQDYENNTGCAVEEKPTLLIDANQDMKKAKEVEKVSQNLKYTALTLSTLKPGFPAKQGRFLFPKGLKNGL